jgi:hypothetical protein
MANVTFSPIKIDDGTTVIASRSGQGTGTALILTDSSLATGIEIKPNLLGGQYNNIISAGDPFIKAIGDGEPLAIGTHNGSAIRTDASTIKFYTSNAHSMTLTNIGLGIGTTSPGAKLHVSQAGNVNGGSLLIGSEGSGTDKWSFLAGAHYNQSSGSGNGSGSAGVALIGSFSTITENRVHIGGSPWEINAATSIHFNTHTSTTSTAGGTERMRIDSSGNVGIGVTPFTNSLTSGLDLKNGGGLFGFANALFLTGNVYYNGAFKAKATAGSSHIKVGDQIEFYVNPSTSADSSVTLTERMRIDSSGNVNIYGTNARPIAITSFDTVSAGAGWDFDATSSNGVVSFSTGGTERMRIDSSGNVIIAQSSSTGVANSIAHYINNFMYVRGGTAGLALGDDAMATSVYMYDNSFMAFNTAGTEAMRIDSSGNVGIGYSTPNSTLTVGSTDATAVITSGGTNTHLSLKAMGSNGVLIFGAGGVSNGTAGTERMRIDSSGSLLMNNTTSVIGVNSTDGADNKRLILSGASSGSTSRGAYILLAGEEYSGINGNASIVTGSSGFFSVNTGGSERMRIDSSGNVGIGDSPTYKLDVFDIDPVVRVSATNASGTSRLELRGLGSDGTGNAIARLTAIPEGSGTASALQFQTRNSSGTISEKMRIDSSGNLSLATATSLDFNVSDFAQIKFKESGAITIDSDNNQSSRNFQFKDGDGSSLMFIGDNGNVGIGTTSPEEKLHVNGIIKAEGTIKIDDGATGNPYLALYQNGVEKTYFKYIDSSDSTLIQSDGYISFASTGTTENFRMSSGGDFHADGDIIAYSTTISDRRLKDEIETIPNALDKVKSMRGVSYVWNNGSRKGQKDLGLIAQEVEEVLPEIVREKEMPLMDDSGEKYKTVDYEKMVGVLIEAVKELSAEVEQLKAKL